MQRAPNPGVTPSLSVSDKRRVSHSTRNSKDYTRPY